jgi:hypothetical protein
MTTLAKFAKGFQGSREVVAKNASGWHLFIDGEYWGFAQMPLSVLRAHWNAYTIIDASCGNISLASDGSKYQKTPDGFEFI